MESPGTEIPSPAGGRRYRTAVALALTLVLAACGSDTTTTTTGGAETTEAPGATDAPGTTGDPGAGDPVELTLWFAREYLPPDQFASLEAEHNIRVTYDVRPGDNMLPTMVDMREAGEPLPDLIEDDSLTTPAYIAAELYQPMTEQIDRFVEEDPELYETILPAVWENGTFDGDIWHASWQSSYDLIYYNVAMLEEAGVSVPFNSWWDVLEAARAVKANNPDMPSVFGTGSTSEDPLFYWLTNFGAPFEGAVPDLTSPGGLDFIDWAQTMFEEGLINPAYVVGEQDESQGAFINGGGAILQDGINAGLDYMAAPGFEYGESGWLSTPMPNEEGGEQMSVPRGWSIVAESEHPYEASLALRYLMDPVNGIPRYLEGSSTPRSTAILEAPEIAEAQPYFTEEIREAFFGVSAQIPAAVNTREVGAILLDMRDDIMVVGTDETPEEVAARYQALLDALE